MRYVFIALMAFLVTACGSDVLDYRSAEISNGLFYEVGANKPFNGTVTNVPESVMPFSDGMNDLLVSMNTVLDKKKRQQDILIGRHLFCDVSTKKGVLDGPAECKNPRSETVRYRLGYKGGVARGEVVVFSYDGQQVLAEGALDDGLLNGAMRLYSPITGEVIVQASLVDNYLHGLHEMFHEETGELTYSATYVDGVLDGEVVRYSADGILVYRGQYEQGVKTGVHEEFSAQTGERAVSAEWANNQLMGTVKKWDESGALVEHLVYDRGMVVADKLSKPAGSAAMDADEPCLEQWIAAYRQEKGPEAIVTAAQLDEWSGWCASGMLP